MVTVKRYRNFNDFKWGSFDIYVTEKECYVFGILKKTNNRGKYLHIITE